MRFPISLVILCIPAAAADFDFFESKIRPVLARQCYACHSEKVSPAQGGLYLDSKEGMLRGGKSGLPAIVPGNPDESLLIKTIGGRNKDLKMPPGKALPPADVEAFVEWVKSGAPDPRTGPANLVQAAAYDWNKEKKHWAYQPVRDPAPPSIAASEWSQGAIDRFIKAKLDEKGLAPAARASRATLIRRLTYDLTGLPPSPQEVSAFVQDSSPRAYEALVDRLLATRAYGEQWGRHWLDLVRYADTAGDASDFPVPEMYRYRNYVIRSIQEDKPFDLFLREQVAGDLMHPRDDEDRRDKIVATSYLANSRRFGQTMREHFLTVDDTLDNLGKSVLGLTLGCARCHDHKFDPIPTQDYWGMYGIFESTRYAHAGLEHHQYLENFVALDPKDATQLDKAQSRMVALHAIVKKGEGRDEKDPVEKRLRYLDAANDLNTLRQSFPDVPMAYAVSEGKPVNSKVMIKGDPATLGPEAPRGFLEILGGQRVPDGHAGSGRDLLAGWLVDRANPLTARVLVNRVWLWHFGRGIVDTPNDFGTRGDRPTHPELLDWLASRFVEDGWSLKKLHKRILMSRAYQSASTHEEANATRDPRNEYYWHFERRRLSAEELRDTLLTAAGNLDPTPGGPHPFPARGSYRFTQHRPFVADLAEYDTNRRSVYLIQQRFRRHPYLELFDGGDPNNSTPARAKDTTALQSLYFFNNDFLHKQADAIAVRVGLAEASTEGRVQLAHQLLYGRDARPAEIAEASRYLAKADSALRGSDMPTDQKNRAALGSLMRVLVAGNEFFYID